MSDDIFANLPPKAEKLGAPVAHYRDRPTLARTQAIVGAAIGAAIAGMRPVAEIMLMNFTTVAMDQIVNHAAKLRFMSGGATGVPITIRTATGAGRGTGAQHSDMLEAWFAQFARDAVRRCAGGEPMDVAGDPGTVRRPGWAEIPGVRNMRDGTGFASVQIEKPDIGRAPFPA